MKRFAAFFTLACLCLLALSSGPVRSQRKGEIHQKGNHIENSYIVVLDDEVVGEKGLYSIAGYIAEDMANVYRGKLKHVYKNALNGFSVEMSEADAEKLSEDFRVKFVEEDAVVTANVTQNNPPWGIDRIDQRDLPLNATYSYYWTGSGVRAYVLDTGIRTTHTQFGGRASNVFDVFGGNGQDCNGHGTHVAGTIGGSTYGVAKSVFLRGVRVLDCNGAGTNADVISGVDWVSANHISPAVANMSLGGGVSSAVDIAVNNLSAAGVPVAVAAGNSNTDACFESPARAADAITVGATTFTDARASFSNFGPCLDIFAPGSGILSAWITSDTATKVESGTSMAAPHVAGLAALYKQFSPGASSTTVRDAIVNNATMNKVTNAGMGSPNRLLYSLFF